MQIVAFYTYAQAGAVLGHSRHTVAKWIETDADKPPDEQRLPGARRGRVPLAALKKATGLTLEELRALDVDLSANGHSE